MKYTTSLKVVKNLARNAKACPRATHPESFPRCHFMTILIFQINIGIVFVLLNSSFSIYSSPVQPIPLNRMDLYKNGYTASNTSANVSLAAYEYKIVLVFSVPPFPCQTEQTEVVEHRQQHVLVIEFLTPVLVHVPLTEILFISGVEKKDKNKSIGQICQNLRNVAQSSEFKALSPAAKSPNKGRQPNQPRLSHDLCNLTATFFPRACPTHSLALGLAYQQGLILRGVSPKRDASFDPFPIRLASCFAPEKNVSMSQCPGSKGAIGKAIPKLYDRWKISLTEELLLPNQGKEERSDSAKPEFNPIRNSYNKVNRKALQGKKAKKVWPLNPKKKKLKLILRSYLFQASFLLLQNDPSRHMVRFPLLAFAKAIKAPVDSDDYPVDSVDEAAKITITLCLLCLAGKKIFVSAELIEASGKGAPTFTSSSCRLFRERTTCQGGKQAYKQALINKFCRAQQSEMRKICLKGERSNTCHIKSPVLLNIPVKGSTGAGEGLLSNTHVRIELPPSLTALVPRSSC
ncbi:SH3 domain protein [Striga asiatica]|uniref:SH3 domain protein n=1 Tax=Striga asiatica TaxID=4170 RepID=A0A5A7Q1N3_STRAF|nr:SH3 domain protein [Striga asiatica]